MHIGETVRGCAEGDNSLLCTLRGHRLPEEFWADFPQFVAFVCDREGFRLCCLFMLLWLVDNMRPLFIHLAHFFHVFMQSFFLVNSLLIFVVSNQSVYFPLYADVCI